MLQQQKECTGEDDEDDEVAQRCFRSHRQQATYQQVNEQDGYADDVALLGRLKDYMGGYLLLSVYLALLIIPVYAIVNSAIRRDWLMMIIDTLLIPVGFIHGILMLLGIA